MAKVFKDIMLDENNDLLIRGGDFSLGDSLSQEVALILSLAQGQLRQYPLLGPSLFTQMKGDISQLKRKIKLHLQQDNKSVQAVDIVSGKLSIKAKNI